MAEPRQESDSANRDGLSLPVDRIVFGVAAALIISFVLVSLVQRPKKPDAIILTRSP